MENVFHYINNLHQNIKVTMEKESFETLLKRNNGKISVLVYRKATHTQQYLMTMIMMMMNFFVVSMINERRLALFPAGKSI